MCHSFLQNLFRFPAVCSLQSSSMCVTWGQPQTQFLYSRPMMTQRRRAWSSPLLRAWGLRNPLLHFFWFPIINFYCFLFQKMLLSPSTTHSFAYCTKKRHSTAATEERHREVRCIIWYMSSISSKKHRPRIGLTWIPSRILSWEQKNLHRSRLSNTNLTQT